MGMGMGMGKDTESFVLKYCHRLGWGWVAPGCWSGVAVFESAISQLDPA